MTPTPTKLALLMSAAGLGLSLPGLALARAEACEQQLASSADVQAIDDAPGHLGAAIAQPMASAAEARQSIDVEWSEEAFRAYCASLALPPDWPPAVESTRQRIVLALPARVHRANALPALSKSNESAPLRDARGATRANADDADRDATELADALAMILMADPPPPSRGIASSDGVGEADDILHLTAGPTRADTIDSAQLADLVDDAAAQADEPGSLPAQTSIERVLDSLAEIVGSGAEAIADVPDAAEARAAAQHDVETAVPAIAAGEVVEASPVAADSAEHWHARAIDRSDASRNIVVMSHGDKVMMSLAALFSDEVPASGKLGAQTKETVVASHSEKVLETLALFKRDRAKRPDRSMTRAPGTTPLDVLPLAFARSAAPRGGPTAPAISTPALVTVSRASAGDHLSAVALPMEPATPHTASRNPIGDDVVALSADKLDEVRGGFITDGGLKVSFGIERAVYLNGALVTTTSLNVVDLSKISGGQAQVTTSGTGSLALVQSGLGNVFPPGSITQTAAGTVIQNTLDSQKIQTITRIDAVVNSSGIMRSLNLQSSMRSAVVDSLRR